MSDKLVVLCPFWRGFKSKRLEDRVCDNLRDGLPLCIVNGWREPDDYEFDVEMLVGSMSEEECRAKFPVHYREYCEHVSGTALYESFRPMFVKPAGCFFGLGLCVRPKAHGFDGCSKGCPIWKL